MDTDYCTTFIVFETVCDKYQFFKIFMKCPKEKIYFKENIGIIILI